MNPAGKRAPARFIPLLALGGLAMTAKDNSLDPEIVSQFHGSEHWYRHGLVPTILFTDGAKYVADAAGAYWLLDEIALAQRYVKTVAPRNFRHGSSRSNPTAPPPSPARTAII